MERGESRAGGDVLGSRRGLSEEGARVALPSMSRVEPQTRVEGEGYRSRISNAEKARGEQGRVGGSSVPVDVS